MFVRYVSLYLLILLPIAHADLNTTLLDNYHHEICNWLMETSNDIDNYFIESNESLQSKTYAELKLSSAIETARTQEYALRLRLRLNLPKLQKKLHIIFEDEESDDLSSDGTSLHTNYNPEDQSYFLRIEYLNYIRQKFDFTAGPGIRFRQSSLHPYLNFKAKYKLEEGEIYQSLLFNRFRVYIDGDFENSVGFDRFHYLDPQFFTLFHNSLTYRSWEKESTLYNAFSLIYSVKKDEKFVIGSSMTTLFDDQESTIDHLQFYVLYRHRLYKKWSYIELNPSLLRRKENDYGLSARFMVNVGVRFQKH